LRQRDKGEQRGKHKKRCPTLKNGEGALASIGAELKKGDKCCA